MTLRLRQLVASSAGAVTVRSAATLSFIAAYVDTCGFIGLFGLFTAHVTGNFVLIGAAVANRHFSLVAKLAATPVFVLGVIATVLVVRLLGGDPGRRLRALLYLMTALLALAMLIAAPGLASAHDADDWVPLAAGMVLAFAMGVQNAVMRLELREFPPTTAMTSNVTQAAIDAVTLLLAALDRPEPTPEDVLQARMRLGRMLPLIGMFGLGAAAGALGYAVAGFWCLAVPIALSLGLALALRVGSRC